MSIMQLIYFSLFWTSCGMLASYIAKRKNRNPIVWFLVGVLFSLFGVIMVALLPPARRQAEPPPRPLAPAFPKRSEAWIKMWYYLDRSHAQQGPFEFPDLIKEWREKGISEASYIWGEGMKEWKKLSEMPDLIEEIEQAH